MDAGHAWVLNLDADLELAAGQRYAATHKIQALARSHAERLASSLLGPHDRWIDGDEVRVAGMPGRAFCPTPTALRLLRRAGAVPAPSPPFEVLRRVNGRAFAQALGPTLPGARFFTDLEEARAWLETRPEVASTWRVKRAFGMSGRGQKVFAPGAVDLPFLEASMRGGGVQIEPNVRIDTEYGIHGMLAEDGTASFGQVVRQRCSAAGAWLATEPLADPEAHGEVPASLLDEAQRVAGALHRAGYFGPFGIDAFTYLDREGSLRWQPRSEINARYSMGFAVGFLCCRSERR